MVEEEVEDEDDDVDDIIVMIDVVVEDGVSSFLCSLRIIFPSKPLQKLCLCCSNLST